MCLNHPRQEKKIRKKIWAQFLFFPITDKARHPPLHRLDPLTMKYNLCALALSHYYEISTYQVIKVVTG